MSLNFTRKMFGGTPDSFRLSLLYQAGADAVVHPWRIPDIPMDEEWPPQPPENNPSPSKGTVQQQQQQQQQQLPLNVAPAPGSGPTASGGNCDLSNSGRGMALLLPGGSQVNVDWTSDDSEKEVLERLLDVQRTVQSLASKVRECRKRLSSGSLRLSVLKCMKALVTDRICFTACRRS
jgi:hypothetical protein